MKRLIPLYDRVLVELLPDEQTSAGGLILPDIAKDKKCEGKVIEVGTHHAKNLVQGESMKTRPLTVSEAGRIGGMTTFEKYGQEFMSAIAKRGARLKKKTTKKTHQK